MLDRIPPNSRRWIAIEVAGLLMVCALVLLYGRFATGVAANSSSGPVAWVPAPTATLPPTTPLAGQTPTPRPVPPTATSTSSPVPTPTPIIHKVQSGQTLSQIAAQYGVSNDSIATANNLRDRNNLLVGQELTIPVPQPPAAGTPGGLATTAQVNTVPRSYKVQGGDTLSGIAENMGVSTSAILRANNLDDADSLKIGQELIIPAR